MSDSQAGTGSGRGMLEEIGLHIPGFKGYLRRELRRDADRSQRDFLARELKRALDRVEAVKRDIAAKADFARLPTIEGITDRFSRIISRVRSADSGYSGFFDTNQVGERELAALYEADLALIGDAKTLDEVTEALASAAGELDARLTRVDEAIRQFDGQFDRRREILKGA